MDFLKNNKLFFIGILAISLAIPKFISAQDTSIDSVYSNDGNHKMLFVGHQVQGQFVGLWTGKDCSTDSIKYYLVFQNGYRMSQYYLDPKYGPLLIFQINKTLDTLTEHMYKTGRLEQVFVWNILSDSLLRKNDVTSSFKREAPGRLIRNYQYNYDYRDITDFTFVAEIVYGSKNYSHYYYKGEYICTIGDKGKIIRGNKKRYEELMKKHK